MRLGTPTIWYARLVYRTTDRAWHPRGVAYIGFQTTNLARGRMSQVLYQRRGAEYELHGTYSAMAFTPINYPVEVQPRGRP